MGEFKTENEDLDNYLEKYEENIYQFETYTRRLKILFNKIKSSGNSMSEILNNPPDPIYIDEIVDIWNVVATDINDFAEIVLLFVDNAIEKETIVSAYIEKINSKLDSK
jgi:hypothetical protein